MRRVALVVHGVGNPVREPFQQSVERLQIRVGSELELIPVFWGDRGARVEGIREVIPTMGREVRATERATDEGLIDPQAVATLLTGQRAETARVVRAEDEPAAVIARGARAGLGGDERETRAAEDDLLGIIREELPRTEYLRLIENDAVLFAVGQMTGRATAQMIEREPPQGRITRETRWGGVTRLDTVVRRILHDVDLLIGTVAGETFGRIHSAIRTMFAPSIAQFVGDVLVYQHHRAHIMQRIWEAIDGNENARGSGIPDRPIHVIAHSLGGVISFHAATAGDGVRILSIDGFVTFGSQSTLFHVIDPQASGLEPFRQGHPPVRLGMTIRRWTNLWEPLDPLAFVASRVFHVGDPPHPPVDLPTRHLASSGLWTHSSYWESDDLVDAIQTTLT